MGIPKICTVPKGASFTLSTGPMVLLSLISEPPWPSGRVTRSDT